MNLYAIVKATLYLQEINNKLGYVPDFALTECRDLSIEEARKIRDVVQTEYTI